MHPINKALAGLHVVDRREQQLAELLNLRVRCRDTRRVVSDYLAQGAPSTVVAPDGKALSGRAAIVEWLTGYRARMPVLFDAEAGQALREVRREVGLPEVAPKPATVTPADAAKVRTMTTQQFASALQARGLRIPGG